MESRKLILRTITYTGENFAEILNRFEDFTIGPIRYYSRVFDRMLLINCMEVPVGRQFHYFEYAS